jgi:hypothetical protein
LNHFFEWIKGHHKRAIIIVILSTLSIVFGIPAIINICFKIPAPCGFLEPEWKASDVLAYYGGVLSFLSTASLSMLALYQNYEIKKESDAKQALLEKMAYEKDMPLFRIKNSFCCGNWGNLNLTILNLSDNVAYDLVVSEFIVKNSEDNQVYKSNRPILKRTEMLGRTENTIEFANDNLSGENLKLSFAMQCKDKFCKEHTYVVSSEIKDSSKFESLYRIAEV